MLRKTLAFSFAAMLAISVAAPLFGSASSVLASNDPVVVGDQCSGEDDAVGQPTNEATQANPDGDPNAVDFGTEAAPVDGPASRNNPGQDNSSGTTEAQSESIIDPGATNDCDPRT